MLVKFSRPLRGVISPCNGLSRCFRHPDGCAAIIHEPRAEYAIRQRYKARRRLLWHIVRDHYRMAAKWGLNPPPPEHHLTIVLLLEQVEREQAERDAALLLDTARKIGDR